MSTAQIARKQETRPAWVKPTLSPAFNGSKRIRLATKFESMFPKIKVIDASTYMPPGKAPSRRDLHRMDVAARKENAQ